MILTTGSGLLDIETDVVKAVKRPSPRLICLHKVIESLNEGESHAGVKPQKNDLSDAGSWLFSFQGCM